MSDRIQLFHKNIEEADLFERLVNDSISLSKLHKLIGNSESMTMRHGNWWWLKENQHIKIATLHRILKSSEFITLTDYMSEKWKDEKNVVSRFYYLVSRQMLQYDVRLHHLIRFIEPYMVERCLFELGLEKDDVTAHMNVLDQLKIREKNLDTIIKDVIITVYRTTKDIFDEPLDLKDRNYYVDGRVRGQLVGIEFNPWNEWLGMKVELGSRVLYGDSMIVACCLYEMTFIDFDETRVQEKFNSIKSSMRQVKTSIMETA